MVERDGRDPSGVLHGPAEPERRDHGEEDEEREQAAAAEAVREPSAGDAREGEDHRRPKIQLRDLVVVEAQLDGEVRLQSEAQRLGAEW